MSLQLLLDQNGCVIFAGNLLTKMLGYSSADLENCPIFDLLEAKDADPVKRFITSRTEDTLILDAVPVKAKCNNWKWMELSLTRLPEGYPIAGSMVSLREVKNTINTHKVKHQITSAYASLFALHPFGIMQMGVAGNVCAINPQLHSDWGYDLDTLRHATLIDVVLPHYRQKVLMRYQQACKNGEPSTFDVQIYHSDGRPVYVNLTIVPVVHQTELLELYLVVKDISSRIQLQDNLKKLSIVADKTTNGVAILNSHFEIEWVNDGFSHISGYEVNECIGERIGSLLRMEHDGSAIAESGRQMIKSGKSIEHELICYRKDGNSFWNLLKLTPIINEHGEMERCITIHDDITEKKKAELDLRMLADDLYKQNKELHQFAYVVSHNLRTPVANILGLANLMETFKDDAETQSQALVELSKAVHNLDAVIKDLSYILTVTDGSKEVFKEPVNIQDLLEQVITDMNSVIVDTDADIKLPVKPLVIRTSRAYVYSIFYNLISNALKYRSQHSPYVKVDYYNTTDHTVIYVADNGKGIDLNKHANDLFKPYKRFDLRAEGRGLGLFLVKSHIEAMGGELSVKSELQKGSTFYIKIPLS